MLQLFFFGRPHLTRAEAASEDLPLQGFPLAMLAALAVAGQRGLARERLVALLWPDVDSARAGHRLTQLRYALRKTLLVDPIVGTTDLRLDRSKVLTDVQSFTEALAQENLEEAVHLAREHFLDGFYLRESPEFDRWADEIRWEFDGQVSGALEQLITAADKKGDARTAARWLEKIVRRDPSSEATAVRALSAYEAAGDHSHARRLADWLERTLREDYDAEPEAGLKTAISAARSGLHHEPSSASNIPAIAVLPLRNISPEPENEFFSDGMTDEIRGALARMPGLRVASRTSSYSFKGMAVDVRQIADQLGVNLVVEGSLRKVGNRIRLVAQLVSAADGCELWSGTFDRTIEDVFELQTELASAIVEALPLGVMGTTMRGVQAAAPTDPETFTLYLKGRYWAYKRSIESLQLATEYFDQAVERDPSFAPGWTGIAECQTMLGFPEFGNLPPQQAMPRAKAAVIKALEAAPTSPEAHLWSGVLGLVYDWDWAASEKAFQEALRLHPLQSLAESWYGMLLSALGRHEEAVRRVERATVLDPLALTIHLTHGRALYFAGRFEEAVRSIESTFEKEPRNANVRIWLCRTLLMLGRYDEALQCVQESPRPPALEGYLDCLRAVALIGLGRKEILLSDPASSWTYMVGAVRDVDDGIAALERCWEQRIGHLAWMATEPLCDPLRSHPGYIALRERMGLAEVPPTRPAAIAVSARTGPARRTAVSRSPISGA
jgi:TolB-like protein/Tfp pilus assembly protein PilF